MASRELSFDRDSSLLVARGLHVLRYEARGDGHDHPVAVVLPATGFEHTIQVISAPGGVQGRLDRPGAAVLIRAEDHGQIKIGVKRKGSAGSLDAAFRLESVGLLADGDQDSAAPADAAKPRLRAVPTEAPAHPKAPADAVFLAHVSRRGDVAVKANEWAGGPDAPARIEALTLLGFGREGLNAEIQILGARQGDWSPWAGEGVFVGTKGRSEPLVGVRLRLTGDQAPLFIVRAEALFLGSPILVKRGREVECVSESGRDPLVGLRFEIGPERRAVARPAAAPAERDERPRVRIFRADDR